MRILVAGGAGYIGSRMIPVLLEHGYKVDVVDLLWFGNQLPEDVSVVKKDLFKCHPEDLKDYTPPDPHAPGALRDLEEVVARYKGRRAIFFIARDAYFNPAHLRGVEQFLMDIVLNPRFVHDLIEVCQSHDLPLIKRAVEAGAEIIIFGDDYADKNAPFMSPRHFEQLFLPGLKKAVETAHEAGAYVIKHTDGNIEPILDMIVSTGVDGLHPLEPAAGMSLGKVRERYGNRICLCGNVDCGPLLTWGTPGEVTATVRECFRDAARDGAYILSSSNSIHSSVKPENTPKLTAVGIS